MELLTTNFLGWQLLSLSDPLAFSWDAVPLLCALMVQRSARGMNGKNLGIPFFVLSLPGLPLLPLAAVVLSSWAQKMPVFPPASAPACITRPAPHPWLKTAEMGSSFSITSFTSHQNLPPPARSPVLSVPPFCYVHTVKSYSIITVNRNLTDV